MLLPFPLERKNGIGWMPEYVCNINIDQQCKSAWHIDSYNYKQMKYAHCNLHYRRALSKMT